MCVHIVNPTWNRGNFQICKNINKKHRTQKVHALKEEQSDRKHVVACIQQCLIHFLLSSVLVTKFTNIPETQTHLYTQKRQTKFSNQTESGSEWHPTICPEWENIGVWWNPFHIQDWDPHRTKPDYDSLGGPHMYLLLFSVHQLTLKKICKTEDRLRALNILRHLLPEAATQTQYWSSEGKSSFRIWVSGLNLTRVSRKC